MCGRVALMAMVRAVPWPDQSVSGADGAGDGDDDVSFGWFFAADPVVAGVAGDARDASAYRAWALADDDGPLFDLDDGVVGAPCVEHFVSAGVAWGDAGPQEFGVSRGVSVLAGVDCGHWLRNSLASGATERYRT